MAAQSPSQDVDLSDSDDSIDSTSKDLILIDPNGNLKLVVGPEGTRFLVDANALRRSSKVFERLLFHVFEAPHHASIWTFERPSDKSQSFKLLLDAAHANFGEIPKALGLAQLHDLAAVAEKYGMLKLLRPWAAGWTSKWRLQKPETGDSEKTATFADILKISVLYHLGTPESFAEFLVNVILKTKADADGDLVFSSRKSQAGKNGAADAQDVKWSESDVYLPDELLDLAGELRRKAIQPLLDSFDQMFRGCTSEVNKYNLHTKCASAALGVMIQRLVQHDLWPVPAAKDFRLSTWELSRITSAIEAEACKCRIFRQSEMTRYREPCMFHILVQMDCEMQVDLREQVLDKSAAHFENIGAEIPGEQKEKLRDSL